jgi:hypothetical protein
MPFLGLIDSQGEEIGGDGYHRIDASEITFKLSPARDAGIDFIFVNVSMIAWPKAKNTWPDVSGFCVFAEVDALQPVIRRQFSRAPMKILAYDNVAIAPGRFTIEHTVSSNIKRQRCPKCGHEWSHEE